MSEMQEGRLLAPASPPFYAATPRSPPRVSQAASPPRQSAQEVRMRRLPGRHFQPVRPYPAVR